MALCKFKYVASEIVEYLLRQTIRFTQPDALNDPFEMKRFREKHIEQTTSELWAAPAAATSIIMDQLTKHPTEIPLVSSTDALKELLQPSLNFIKNIPGNSLAAEWMKCFLPASGQTFTAPSSDKEILDKRKQAQEWIGKMDQYAILSLTQYADN